jgi:hypothetical protein
MKEKATQEVEEPEEEFGELIKFTASGFAGGLVVAALLDAYGFHRNPVGQWIVRTLSGEGESILEGFYAIRRRLGGQIGSMAEAYGWGKLFGMMIPWLIDWGSRLLGVDVYGVESFYIPYFYAMSDQIGANIGGYIFLRKRTGSWSKAVIRYGHHPVMLASLGVILLVPLGLLGARILGFRPTTHVLTALETIAANLCWVPPLLGWIRERNKRKAESKG